MVVSTSEQYSFVNAQRCVKIWNHTQQTRLYTQSAITKFHFRCQILQTYKATSIIQRQIPPSIHIIRYQSNSKLINHRQSSSIPRISHQSNLWDISHVPWLRLGPFFGRAQRPSRCWTNFALWSPGSAPRLPGRWPSTPTATVLTKVIWLVVDLPLWIWVCQLGWWHSQDMGKTKCSQPPTRLLLNPTT